MGAGQQFDIHGAKGGSTTPKSPTEATDSLRSTNLAKILIAVGEGEFSGTPTAKNIYLDNTPIEDASGNINFPNVKWEWRSGSVEQSYIPGIPSVENETTVNVELRNDTPWIRSITNTQLSAVRVRLAWPALQAQDDEGNVGGYRIEYAIDIATDGGAYQQVLLEAADGKTTTRYERSRRIDLPASTSGWQIRVRRITPNQNTNKIADAMLVAGLTEVIDKKLRYPNTALLYIEFDAEQFTNIPAVTVETDAKKWQVPSNYDPVNRTYSGVWDGTFKEAWTNNAAWITYGVCTEDRFGLGKRIKPFMVDKWELYRIAQYCDVAVSNGVGGLEPRFLCDMNIQGKSDAWGLLRDISAIYRGMTYWAQGQLVMQADMPRAQDFDYVFTRANVIDGKFSYGSASAKTRYTRAIVSYDNPANNYDTDVIPYADLDLQRRFGDKPVEISAIGCTRASEAQRRGKWVVLTNNLDRTVSFKTGMEGAIPLPGYIIPIADSLLAGREIGGRISAVAGRVLTLDRDTEAKAGDRLIINLPSGKAVARTVQSVAGRAVTVTTAYSEAPIAELQWAIDADDLAIPLYRVMSVKRTTEGDYEISALQYEPSKFAAIDTGARLEENPISVIPITVVPPPESVAITSTTAIAQGLAVTTMTISWPGVAGAVAYDVEWRKDNGNWIKVQRTGTTSVDIPGIYSGGYLARVRAVSAYDITSIWKSSNLTQLNGKEGLPPALTSLVTESLLFGIGVKWTFPDGAEDTQRTELWYGTTPVLDAATKLADLAYPQSDYTLQELRAGATLFFWARLVDRSGNIGPWFPVGPGISGQASSDADAILDLLVGKITESQLGQELLSEIGQIGGDGPGSINARLDEVRTEVEAIRSNLQAQIGEIDSAVDEVKQDLLDSISDLNTQLSGVQAELQAQIDSIAELADSMPYKADQTYTAGQGVLGANGIIYQATQNVPVNTPPPNATYWLDVGQAVVTANGLATRVQTVETKVTSIEGVNTAQATQITQLRTDVDGKASGTALQSLTTRVTTAEGTITSQGTAITNLTSTVAGKADATALTALTTRVTAAEGVNTSQATQITNLTTTVNGKAEASAVQALTTRVTATEGKNSDQDATITSQGQAITTLNNALPGKADASAVTALTNRVTTAEGTISSQGTAITSLNGSLTTTNQNVTAAQNAANAANTLAGGKGKVLFQTSTPVAADQLAQNLWIDITNGANTPKRWSGTAWVVATDKAATDAAAAAASALAQVATKAEASTVTALSQLVTQQGNTITAQGSSITDIAVSIGSVGGENLLYNPSFEKLADGSATTPDGWAFGVPTGVTWSSAPVNSSLDPSGKAQRVDASGMTTSTYVDTTPAAAKRPAVSVGQVVTLSAYVRGTAGLGFQLFLQHRNAAGTVLATASQGVNLLTDGWQRITLTSAAVPADAVNTSPILRMRPNTSGSIAAGFIEIDRAQLEISPVVSGWKDNGAVVKSDVAAAASATSALTARVTQTETTLTSQGTQLTNLTATVGGKADSAAVTALTARVTQTETDLTSVSNNVTSLTNSIGDIGSDNLLPNSSFEQVAGNGIPVSWQVGSTAGQVPTLTMVDSPLPSSTKAVRLTRAALANGAYIDLNLAVAPADRPNVVPGKVYTLSAYARLSSPSARLAMYVQWLNASNTVISTIQLTEVAVGTTFTRFSVVGTAPALAVKATIFAGRLLNRSGAAADMWIEIDNVQFEQGTIASGYSPSAKLGDDVAAAANAATSTAVDVLTSTVTQQGATISSVSGRTTVLENAVTSTTDGLATKASAAALSTLTNRVTSIEGVNTSQASSITDLNTSVSNISGQIGTAGIDPSPGCNWNFDYGTEGWSAQAATITSLGDGIRISATSAGPTILTSGLAIDGGLFRLVKAKITRRAGATTDWDGACYFGNADHGFSSSFYSRIANPNLAIGQSAIVTWDMTTLTAGGGDWVSHLNTDLRLNFGAVNGSVFDVDWIVVGRMATAASSRALSQLSSTVTQQGATISAQASSITSLSSTVGNHTSQLQSQATTIADSAGKLSSSYTLKLALTSDGKRYAAGIGLGLDNSSGTVQSQFLVSADRFAVLNDLAGNVTSPFAVEGGQVFIRDAVIKKATITNALVGAAITSQTLTSYGTPVMTTDYSAGQITIQNQSTNGKYMVIRQDGIFSVSAGVVMFELQL